MLSKRYAGNAPAAENNAEGGTDGATVTQGATGNTGGASGTYFDIVTEGAGNTLQFQNSPTVKDTLAYEMAAPAATQNYLEWDVAARIGATQNQMYARWYVRTPSTPTALHRIYRVRGGLPSLTGIFPDGSTS